MTTSIANDLLLETAGTGMGGGVGPSTFTSIQELSTAGASKASLDVVLHHLDKGGDPDVNVRATVRGSNDRVNWTNLTGAPHVDLIAVGKGPKSNIPIDGWAFVHVLYELTAFDNAHKAVLTSAFNVGN